MNNEQLIKELQTKTNRVFQSLVGDCDEVPILDFPDIKNVGDSAIWLGEVEYLKNFHGVKPGYVSTIKSYDPAVLKRMHPEGNIFIHAFRYCHVKICRIKYISFLCYFESILFIDW